MITVLWTYVLVGEALNFKKGVHLNILFRNFREFCRCLHMTDTNGRCKHIVVIWIKLTKPLVGPFKSSYFVKVMSSLLRELSI